MASNLAERPELTIWAQFVALIIFHSDLAIRYLPGLYSQIKGARGPKFQFEDCLTLILWVSLTEIFELVQFDANYTRCLSSHIVPCTSVP